MKILHFVSGLGIRRTMATLMLAAFMTAGLSTATHAAPPLPDEVDKAKLQRIILALNGLCAGLGGESSFNQFGWGCEVKNDHSWYFIHCEMILDMTQESGYEVECSFLDMTPKGREIGLSQDPGDQQVASDGTGSIEPSRDGDGRTRPVSHTGSNQVIEPILEQPVEASEHVATVDNSHQSATVITVIPVSYVELDDDEDE